MGYTHYYKTEKPLDAEKFKNFSVDVQKLVDKASKNGINIVNGMGEIGTKPTINASIISLNGEGENAHETLIIRKEQQGFEFCKTARKPYDIVVASILIALGKHYSKDVEISSDGTNEDEEWKNAKEFCQETLGYGETYMN